MGEFWIKQNDLRPQLTAYLSDVNGPLGLPSGTTIYFNMYPDSFSGGFSKAMSIINSGSGIVAYSWVSGDTSVAGDYLAEILTNFTDGTSERFPNFGYIQVHILECLA